jgi:hypothetical protein
MQMMFGRKRMYRAFGAAGIALLAACAADDVTVERTLPGFTVNPAGLTLAPGETGTVVITVSAGSPVRGARFSWSIAQAGVARLDSVSADSRRAYVDAVATGSAALQFSGGGFTGTVPIQVR